jgi:exodeoxyribonuclease VII small subunit
MSIENGQNDAELTFEQAHERLEAVVRGLEDGQIGLTESLAQYEQGVRLLRRCHELLEAAQQKIELLSGIDAAGRPITEPFDDRDSMTLAQEGNLPANRRRATPRRGATTPRRESQADPPASPNVDDSGSLF